MTREEAITKYILPAVHHHWNEKIYDEIEQMLEQEPCEGRMKNVQETVNTIMDSCKTNSVKDKCFRNVARFIQNAIDGSNPEFELINDAEPCEDAISRAEAIKALEYDLSLEADGGFDKYRTVIKDLLNAIYNTQKANIEKLPPITPKPKTGWISVSERLPEDNYAVLVWCPERKNIYCAYLEEKQWWIFGAYFQKVTLEVIAWMPLPEPYKAESEDKE